MSSLLLLHFEMLALPLERVCPRHEPGVVAAVDDLVSALGGCQRYLPVDVRFRSVFEQAVSVPSPPEPENSFFK